MKVFTDYEREYLISLTEDLFAHGFKNAIIPWCDEDIYDTTDEWVNSHYHFLKDKHCYLVHGMTRVVVINEDFPWVLKFNFKNLCLNCYLKIFQHFLNVFYVIINIIKSWP